DPRAGRPNAGDADAQDRINQLKRPFWVPSYEAQVQSWMFQTQYFPIWLTADLTEAGGHTKGAGAIFPLLNPPRWKRKPWSNAFLPLMLAIPSPPNKSAR